MDESAFETKEERALWSTFTSLRSKIHPGTTSLTNTRVWCVDSVAELNPFLYFFYPLVHYLSFTMLQTWKWMISLKHLPISYNHWRISSTMSLLWWYVYYKCHWSTRATWFSIWVQARAWAKLYILQTRMCSSLVFYVSEPNAKRALKCFSASDSWLQEDERIRKNRLALLRKISDLPKGIVDLSILPGF